MTQQGQRIVVTGATGFLGRRIVQRLAERGDSPIAFVRDVEAARRSVPQAAEYVHWTSSLADGPWKAALDGAHGVINLAGTPVAERWTERHKASVRNTRVEGTNHLVNAIRKAANPPAVLVNASAVGYYGTSPSARFTEDSPHGSDFLGTTCAAWEQSALAARVEGVRVAMIRIGIVLDPHGGALERLLLPFKLFVGGPVAPGSQWFPWVHINDVVEMVLWALDTQEVEGPVNCAAPGIVDNRAFSKALGAALHRPAIFTVPRFVIRLILGEGAYILTEGQYVVPARAEQLGYKFLFSNIKEALRDLLR